MCNTTAQVMCTIPWQRAVNLLCTGKAVSIKDSNEVIHSPSTHMFIPDIIMLSNYVNEGKTNRYDVIGGPERPLSKKLIHERDNWVCAYCGDFGDTVDHIVPKALGGKDSWDNVITACITCNGLKGKKMLSEIGWVLRYEPVPLTRDNLLRAAQQEVNDYFATL